MNRTRYPFASPQNKNPRQGPIPILDGMLANAIKHHRQGRLPEAERIYRQILAIDPCHADCSERSPIRLAAMTFPSD